MLLTSASESVTAYTIRSYLPCALRRKARPSWTLTETSGLAYGWAGLSRLEMSTMAGSISTESMWLAPRLIATAVSLPAPAPMTRTRSYVCPGNHRSSWV